MQLLRIQSPSLTRSYILWWCKSFSICLRILYCVLFLLRLFSILCVDFSVTTSSCLCYCIMALHSLYQSFKVGGIIKIRILKGQITCSRSHSLCQVYYGEIFRCWDTSDSIVEDSSDCLLSSIGRSFLSHIHSQINILRLILIINVCWYLRFVTT